MTQALEEITLEHIHSRNHAIDLTGFHATLINQHESDSQHPN